MRISTHWRKFSIDMRMRMRISRNRNANPMSKPNENKVRVNCTFSPRLKSWAAKYAKQRFDESFSALCERLLKAEQNRENDRMRRAAA